MAQTIDKFRQGGHNMAKESKLVADWKVLIPESNKEYLCSSYWLWNTMSKLYEVLKPVDGRSKKFLLKLAYRKADDIKDLFQELNSYDILCTMYMADKYEKADWCNLLEPVLDELTAGPLTDEIVELATDFLNIGLKKHQNLLEKVEAHLKEETVPLLKRGPCRTST